jgi:hypothetical protein
MKRVVLGIVDTPAHADLTVGRLIALGFAPGEVSVLYPDRHGKHDFGFEAHTKTPEFALAGVCLGAAIGATVGIALGIAGAIPALAGLLQTGPLITALAGAAVGALLLGVIGAIAGATVPEIEAKHYDGKTRVGSILIGVHARSREEVARARAVLHDVAASEIHTAAEAALPLSSLAGRY